MQFTTQAIVLFSALASTSVATSVFATFFNETGSRVTVKDLEVSNYNCFDVSGAYNISFSQQWSFTKAKGPYYLYGFDDPHCDGAPRDDACQKFQNIVVEGLEKAKDTKEGVGDDRCSLSEKLVVGVGEGASGKHVARRTRWGTCGLVAGLWHVKAGATARGLFPSAMGDNDPPPFGYTFSGSYFDHDLDASHALLTDIESQNLADFFTNTDPFLTDSHSLPPTSDTKNANTNDDFSDWANFITPATVHSVSTTIPDQAHLHNGFFNEHTYTQPQPQSHLQPQPPLSHLGNTHDDIQAASTLFHNSQSSYTNNGSQSFHGLPTQDQPSISNNASAVDHSGKPHRITPHGLINEQLAALLPNHNEEGTLDAQFAAQWAGTNAIAMHEHEIERPNLKRSYTFGTDDSFNNPTGYSGPHGQDMTDQVTRRLMRDMRHSQQALQTVSTNGTIKSEGYPADASDDEHSEEASTDEDEDEKPSKKRRKGKPGKDSTRKGARNGKSRKASSAEENGKKKRAAAQKLQRENLTEEQKRSNHILSEQKRRNLIKRGFDDLHDLVPEIRNGGLSKSSVLTEAANFLEKVIEENKKFRQIMGG
ncbi:hypothetical protein BDU57DRAFT_529842 [Ampelomyces quisqualis]|uniref:BHLH domain-containing protein n=1 Tax=Ampelomyces quisqualis TaxID=50730 RepID=A0A6A5QND2_AMPQU|nr:hypothetical protein BDU57DRAFT_529842 [Ampelomyces quisqualis]